MESKQQWPVAELSQKRQENKRTLILTPASQVKSVRQRWLLQDKIPMSTLSNFVGMGGCGKSSFAIDTAARVTKGELDGDLKGQPRNVLFVGHEDDLATQMKPRLEAAGANLDSIIFLGITMTSDDLTTDVVPQLPIDLVLIRQAIEETNAALVIFDPLTSSIAGNLYHAQDVRQALNPLLALAQETGLSIIGIQHVRKGSGAASDKTAGSHAFRDISRSLLQFARDEEADKTIVTIDKSNYGTSTGNSFAFHLRSVDVATDDGELTSVAVVEHLGDSEISVSDIWNREHDFDDDGEKADIQSFILEVLVDQGGRAKATEVFDAGKTQQYSESQLKKARVRAGVLTQRVGFGKGACSYWIHPAYIESTIETIESPFQNKDSMDSMRTLCETTGAADLAHDCKECAQPLHKVQIQAGELTHPSCDKLAS